MEIKQSLLNSSRILFFQVSETEIILFVKREIIVLSHVRTVLQMQFYALKENNIHIKRPIVIIYIHL